MPISNSSAAIKSSNKDYDSTRVIRHSEFLSVEQSCDSDINAPRVHGYEILSVIGSGGMGIVYKARHRVLNRIVALKLLRGVVLADPDYRERFRAEAEAVARLQHPSIIQVFEVGVTEKSPGEHYTSPFIALEFVDGGSLTQRTDKPQSPRYAAEMVEKLARGVHSAHQQGVIHRDLKPANVLLTREGEPKIADFGIAKQLGAERDGSSRFVTMDGTVMGTPEYMAPEQSAGAAATPATDVYGLGVILYELLAARVPFQGATPLETMSFAQRHEPISPRRFKPDLSRDLETICLKCLEKSPGNRYASAETLASDLRSYLDGRTILARRASEWEKAARWCRRNPMFAATIGGIAATVLIALVLVSRSYWHAELARQNESTQRQAAEGREKAERWERYRANITATASSLELYDTGGARRNLEASPEEHRNWEWHHFNTRIDLAQTVLSLEETPVEERIICRDGNCVFLFGTDKAVRMWQTTEGKLLRVLPATPWRIHTEISNDGRLLAFPAGNGDIVLRKTDDGTGLATTTLRGLNKSATMICFSEDGARLAASVDRTAFVWDVATGKTICVLSPFKSNFYSAHLSPNGRRLVLSDDVTKAVELWDVDSRERIAGLSGHDHPIERYGFDRQGTRMVTITGFPSNLMRLWDLKSGRLLGTMSGHDNTLKKCLFSPDGKRIASCSLDHTIVLWDANTCQPIAKLTGHKGWVNSIAFSPDGKRLVSGSQDHTLRL
ncbi:MAG TPA: serine/threonine-protein kinase [Gemmata sp.]|nr:serine/threonine-protein kinase [Gemmata sp.]